MDNEVLINIMLDAWAEQAKEELRNRILYESRDDSDYDTYADKAKQEMKNIENAIRQVLK